MGEGKTTVSWRDITDKFAILFTQDRTYLWIVIVYGIVVSVLSLAIPISVQALVNIVSMGPLWQPLIILGLVLLFLLLFSGLLKALQFYVMELFHRRFFTRMSATIAEKMMMAKLGWWKEQQVLNLSNRFFEIITLQKTTSSLLVDGVTILLQTIVGLLLMAFYHPFLLGFSVFLLLFLILLWFPLGPKALSTAVQESKAKYRVAQWLDELSLASSWIRGEHDRQVAIKETDAKVHDYLHYRIEHFNNLFKQTCGLIVLYALASALLLSLGGFLVIREQLTLGQLIASELIVTVILTGLSKFGKHLESFYDFYASSDKLAVYEDVPSEIYRGEKTADKIDSLVLERVHPVGSRHIFNFEAKKGDRIFIDRFSLNYEHLIEEVFLGHRPFDSGRFYINGEDIEVFSMDWWRNQVYFLSGAKHLQLFDSYKEFDKKYQQQNAGLWRDVCDAFDVSEDSRPERTQYQLANAIVQRPKLVFALPSFEWPSDAMEKKFFEFLDAQVPDGIFLHFGQVRKDLDQYTEIKYAKDCFFKTDNDSE